MEKLCKIRDVQRAIIQFESEFEKIFGICLNEGMVLCSLKKTAELSSGELGVLLGLSPSNMSKVIDKVEKKGYINRIVGKSDKRQMRFSLADQGMKLLAEVETQQHLWADISEILYKN